MKEKDEHLTRSVSFRLRILKDVRSWKEYNGVDSFSTAINILLSRQLKNEGFNGSKGGGVSRRNRQLNFRQLNEEQDALL